jgi:hypothetical protein
MLMGTCVCLAGLGSLTQPQGLAGGAAVVRVGGGWMRNPSRRLACRQQEGHER